VNGLNTFSEKLRGLERGQRQAYAKIAGDRDARYRAFTLKPAGSDGPALIVGTNIPAAY
jgi:hypothetical protein